MIDIHSHILAGIDDGARTLNDSLALIKSSIEQGVTTIIATPHINIGTFDNDLPTIQKAFDLLIAEVKHQKISIQLGFAAEVRVSPEILILAKTQQLPFIGQSQNKKMLLLEFPHSHVPPGSEKLVDWLMNQGIRPVIAHPERNRDAWALPEIMSPFKQRNCIFQITAGSIVGDFGLRAQQLAWQFLESNLPIVIASDMHNLTKRSSKMLDAYQQVSNKLGQEYAQKCFNLFPNELIQKNSTLVNT